MNKRLKDTLERTAATAAEAGIAYGILQLAGVKAGWAIPVTAVLAYAKSLLAKYVGNPNSASLTKDV